VIVNKSLYPTLYAYLICFKSNYCIKLIYHTIKLLFHTKRKCVPLSFGINFDDIILENHYFLLLSDKKIPSFEFGAMEQPGFMEIFYGKLSGQEKPIWRC